MPKMRQPKCPSTGEWINKLWHPSTEILFRRNKKDQITSSRKNMDESQMPYVKWKRPDSKDYILYDFIYMTFWKMQKNVGNRSVLARGWVGREQLTTKRQLESFGWGNCSVSSWWCSNWMHLSDSKVYTKHNDFDSMSIEKVNKKLMYF